jgi:hypothetical protein
METSTLPKELYLCFIILMVKKFFFIVSRNLSGFNGAHFHIFSPEGKRVKSSESLCRKTIHLGTPVPSLVSSP